MAASDLAGLGISEEMRAALEHAPSGACVSWGIPYEIGQIAALAHAPLSLPLNPTTAQWLVFVHTSDRRQVMAGPGGFISPMRGEDVAYKRMRLVLKSAHRSLHNRMHKHGTYHAHTPVTDHAEHHQASG
jgi:hypothetical protein